MKIVGISSDLLEFEHKSWSAALLGLFLFVFLSIAMIAGGEKQMHIHVFGTLFAALFAAIALLVVETSRVAIDRRAGVVRMFRKRAFRTTRLELPLRDFRGVIPEKVFNHDGWYRRIALVFSDGTETWLIPASRGAERRRLGGLAAEINAWHGTSTHEAETLAGDLMRDARAIEIRLLDGLFRRWTGRG